MLEELTIKNLYSFRDEVCLSFEATNDTFGEEKFVVTMPDGRRLLRFAMIYGANASGKTNVLAALQGLKFFCLNAPSDIDQPTNVIPFRFDTETPEAPTEFSMKFYADGVRYHYILCLNIHSVIEEKLSYYVSNRPTMLFHRKLEGGRLTLSVNPAVHKLNEIELQQLQINCFDNMSFFAARSKVNISLPKIDAVRDWLRNQVLNMVLPGQKMFDYAKKQVEEDPALVPYLLNKLHNSDFNITGMQTTRTPERNIPAEVMQSIRGDKDLSDEEKTELLTTLQTDFEHTVRNSRGEEKYNLIDDLESRGTKRVLGLETVIYRARQKKALMMIDELESSLHPALLERVIYDFLQTKDETQMLITTHYDPLLDLVDDLVRKDCVWFTEKGEDGVSSLYSMDEFAGLNKISSYRRAYRGGRFGATPNI
jgi:AAA15 family ATPase/GTPase